MKKTHFFRFFAFFLALTLCLLPALTSCKTDGGGEATVTEPEATEASIPSFQLDETWYVTRPDTEDSYEVKALQLINRAIQSACGQFAHSTTDYVRRDSEMIRQDHEILIGRTNRPESIEATDSCEGGDALYRVVDEHIIVITGGSGEAILTAAKNFAFDLLGYSEDANRNVLSAGENRYILVGTESRSEIAFSNVIVNGTNLRDYVLVADTFNSMTTAVNAMIAEVCGTKLREVPRSEYTGGAAIFAGCADTPAGHLDVAFDPFTYWLSVSGDKITVDYKTGSAKDNFKCFITDWLPEKSLFDVSVTIPDGLSSHVAIPGEVNGLREKSRTDEKLAEGITYSEILYNDRDGAPVRCYAVIVAPGAGRFYAGTPNDSYVQIEKTTQNVQKEINAAVANGKRVVVGVNSGFFDLGGTGFSRGLVVKDGTLYAKNTERPFFAQYKDGSVHILYSSEYQANSANIRNAVAGCAILLRGGKVGDVARGTDMALTRHPRTAVGITPDGTVVILVVDGRQPKISNGASYADLIEIFRSLGCTEALNLDGGGSSTFIRKNSAGNYVTENSPSDGALRAVQDSLFVLLP